VAEAERLLLPHRHQAHHAGDLLHLRGQLRLAARRQRVLELVRVIEVVLDRALAAAVDQHDLLDAGGDRLLDDELDRRRVDDGQHLLGDGLGGGQEAGAQTGGGDHGLANARLRVGHGPRI
jgi:hypothetical protein